MRIVYKLPLAFFFIATLVGAAGMIMVSRSQHALHDSIGNILSHSAAELMDKVDHNLHDRIEILQAFATRHDLQQGLVRSNADFAKQPDIQLMIDNRDRAWCATPADATSDQMRTLLANPWSQALRQMSDYYTKEYGFPLFAEIFMTNQYGANAAQTGRTTDYKQSDEEWWQQARTQGLHLQDVAFDESAGVYSISVAIRIEDDRQNFLGVMKGVINIAETIRALKQDITGNPFESAHLTLCQREGQVIHHSRSGTRVPQDLWACLRDQEATTGFFTAHCQTHGQEELVAFSRSKGHHRFPGFGWIVLAELDTKKALAPIATLRHFLWVGWSMVLLLIMLLGLYFLHSVARPVMRICQTAKRIGHGDLDAKTGICRTDEVGALAATIDTMTAELKGHVVSRAALQAEVQQRTEAMLALDRTEARLKTILNATLSGILVCDGETRQIVEINPAGARMIGRPKEEIIGHRCHRFICPAEEGQCPVMDLGESVHASERILLNAAGERVPILKTVTAAEIDGRPHVVETFLDLRDIKREQREKDQLERRLLRTEKMEAIGQLAGGIAHEFNNQLAIINGFTELVHRKIKDDPKLDARMQEIRKAGQRAAELTQQLLVYDRTQQIRRELFELDRFLRDHQPLLASAVGKDTVLAWDLQATSATVLTDPNLLEDGLMHLCSNARDALSGAGMVTISTTIKDLSATDVAGHGDAQPGTFVEIAIADTGHGISKENQRRILEPFFSTKEVGEGTGLGLSMVDGLVKQAKGFLIFESQVGEGTTVRLLLPRIT